MKAAQLALLAVLLVGGSRATAQQERRDPHIGYLYPAGGRQNSTVRITIGGQNLRGISDIYINGAGVHAKFLKHFPPLRNITPEQREALASKMRELFAQRWAELEKAGRVGPLPPRLQNLDRPGGAAKDQPTTAPAELPPSPLLYDLEHKSLRELLHIRHMLGALRKGQVNAQIAESVVIEVTIDREASLGEREIRLGGQIGLSNPMVFEVGALPETNDLEEDESRIAELLPAAPPLDLPVVLNGQIMTGDVDRFRFRAKAGQGLVIETHARRLIPYLADAVPGWFQAAVCLYGAAGAEVAYADDYRFDPDPVLYYEVPTDGEYELEIRDSLYRGRQDFVYRITVGEQPFITSLCPLGTTAGRKRYVKIAGWNLGSDRLFLDPGRDRSGIRQKCWGLGKHSSNRVAYAIDEFPAEPEVEPNDTLAAAQHIALPRIIDGRIDQPGDVDAFQFKAKAGSEVVAEVAARRLNSPLDSLLRLQDADGNVLEWNDDYQHKDGFLHMDTGVQTHSADSYLRATLPADGVYYIQVTDAQGQGGPAHGYRLRVSPPQPDFALRVTPSSVNVPVAGAAVLTVHALRKDGFEGEIEVVLADASKGFQLGGATIPAGRDRVRMTLTALRPGGRGAGKNGKRSDEPVVLQLAGRAKIGKQTVSHTAVPAEDMMQAFLYRHLTPSQELMVAVRGNRLPAAEITVDTTTPVRIPAGGTAEVRINIPQRLLDRGLDLQLSEPPPGVTLEKVTKLAGVLVVELKADTALAQPGMADNLIVEGFTEVTRPARAGEAAKPPARTSAGFLPAIPIIIVPG
jgi:hypothetical protein